MESILDRPLTEIEAEQCRVVLTRHGSDLDKMLAEIDSRLKKAKGSYHELLKNMRTELVVHTIPILQEVLNDLQAGWDGHCQAVHEEAVCGNYVTSELLACNPIVLCPECDTGGALQEQSGLDMFQIVQYAVSVMLIRIYGRVPYQY